MGCFPFDKTSRIWRHSRILILVNIIAKLDLNNGMIADACLLTTADMMGCGGNLEEIH